MSRIEENLETRQWRRQVLVAGCWRQTESGETNFANVIGTVVAD